MCFFFFFFFLKWSLPMLLKTHNMSWVSCMVAMALDVIVFFYCDLFSFTLCCSQLNLFQQNARGTRAPPGQPLCEQSVWWSGVHWTSQKIWGQQMSWCALHLWGLPHHSHFQGEGSEAHADAHQERWFKTESEGRTSRPTHGHSLSLWDVRLFPLHHRGWASQTRSFAFLYQAEVLQSPEFCGYTQVWQLAAQRDLAAWQRALCHVWIQKLQVSVI